MPTEDDVGELFKHAGSYVETPLRGPSSQILHLPGPPAGVHPGEKHIDWLPLTRQAMDLEVRAQIFSTTAGVGGTGQQPLVKFRMEIGHGKAVWRRPSGPSKAASTVLHSEYTLPMRGMCIRLSSRELRFIFYCPGDFTTPVPGMVVDTAVQISFQPVLSSSATPVFPRQDIVQVAGAVKQFPMEANEFRLRTLNGVRFAVGATGIVFTAINGGAFWGADAAEFGDWAPIPLQAYGFVMSGPAAPLTSLIDYR